MFEPTGEEREVVQVGGIALDGAPLVYVTVLAGVIAVLTVIPMPISQILGIGKNFPLSQGLYPLIGWLLGPVAGGAVDGIGALVGILINPQNTSSYVGTLLGATLGGFAAGAMAGRERRAWWWLPAGALATVFFALYLGRAVLVNGASLLHVLLGTFINWSALLLYLLPTRQLLARGLRDPRPTARAAALFGGTWMIAGLVHLGAAWLIYWRINWPNEVWLPVAAAAPLEHTFRALIGMVVGVGVLNGLRALKLVPPKHTLFDL